MNQPATAEAASTSATAAEQAAYGSMGDVQPFQHLTMCGTLLYAATSRPLVVPQRAGLASAAAATAPTHHGSHIIADVLSGLHGHLLAHILAVLQVQTWPQNAGDILVSAYHHCDYCYWAKTEGTYKCSWTVRTYLLDGKSFQCRTPACCATSLWCQFLLRAQWRQAPYAHARAVVTACVRCG